MSKFCFKQEAVMHSGNAFVQTQLSDQEGPIPLPVQPLE